MKKQKVKQKDTSTVRVRSPQDSLCGTILKKLSTLEELLKKKDDKPLTFREACSYLGYAPSYLYKLTYRKVIPHYKPTGKMIFFSKNELDEWVFKCKNKKSEISSKNREEEGTKQVGGSTVRQGSLQAPLTAKDPNQIEMELEEEKEKKETEILIEFPLKSRRKK